MKEKIWKNNHNGRNQSSKPVIRCKASTAGITLVALVVTIVVLLILATITIGYILGEHGIIKMATKAKQKWEESVRNEQEDLEKLIGNKGEDKNIQIKVNVKSFNQTLGEFPVVYKITGKKNNKIVCEQMVLVNVKNVGTENLEVVVNVPKGAVMAVEEVYCGASYKLTTEPNIEKVVDEGETMEFIFEHEYNYKITHNTGIKI
ncbi:MAG: hypothetical protein HFJ29_02560 [Clostridia bacterium]|nr:hypothetical protein [Clostridia bacterium]